MSLKARKIFIGTRPRKQFELGTAIEAKGLEIFYNLLLYRPYMHGTIIRTLQVHVLCDTFPIWYNLYNLKKVKNTHGRLLLLVKFQAKSSRLHCIAL